MKILIIGATGFIGSHLSENLASNGHIVTIASRDPDKAARLLGRRFTYVQWDGKNPETIVDPLSSADGVVNLAGENLAAGRWTDQRKEGFLRSRVEPGKALVEAIRAAARRPSVLIQASATGIYGTAADKPAGEVREAGTGYLADLTRQWEGSVKGVSDSGVRLAVIRTGLVLGRQAGILPKLSRAFDFGIGVIPGGGNQWLPWIHIRDEVEAIRFLIENPRSAGAFNLTAPNPVTMRHMVQAIGRIRKRPAWFRIPAPLLRMALGEMADQTVLASQDILPEALLDAGYIFNHAQLEDALHNLLGK